METASLSPFLPNTNIQFAWDSTSLEKLKRCPRLYFYEMICGYQPKDANVHLRFGIEYHQALHDYELAKVAGKKHDDAMAEALLKLAKRIHDFNPTEEDHGKVAKNKNRETLFRTVIWYLDTFQNDPAETLILDNGKPALEVSFRFELDNQPYMLCGHLDRIVTWQDNLFASDRKTTSYSLTPWWFNQWEPNNQMTLYTLAGGIVLHSPIRGILIDAAQIKENETLFGRGVTYRSEGQLEEWIKDLDHWFVNAKTYAMANYWPMNDTACDKYGGCKFREVCNKAPHVRERFLNANFVKGDIWNPLESR